MKQQEKKRKVFLGLIWLASLLAWSGSINAQDPTALNKGDLEIDYLKHRINSARYFDKHNIDLPIDYTVPSSASGYLFLRARGADGGKAYASNTDCGGKAGEGAIIDAVFAIGNGANKIPPGSTIRFLVGLHGENRPNCNDGYDGTGGGGGTGVLYKASGQNEWTLLMVAGGGGGGVYDKLIKVGRDGHPGAITENGDQGGGMKPGSGGSDGMTGGRASSSGGAYGGGGIYAVKPDHNTDGDAVYGEPGWLGVATLVQDATYYADGSLATPKVYSYDYTVEPLGGRGASTNVGHLIQRWGGGWGFSGGGAGEGNGGGGGGGGYSGGGGGDDYGGGGGGSYLSAMAQSSKKIQTGYTCNPQDGYVEYRYSSDTALGYTRKIKLTNNTTNCLTLDDNGSTRNSTNISMATCKSSSKNLQQAWTFSPEDNKIRLLKYNDKCVDVENHNTTRGTNIRLWDCMNHDEQHWIYDGVSRQFRSKLDLEKCMDASLTVGSNVKLWDCSTTTHQKWDVPGTAAVSNPTAIKYIVPVKDNYSNTRALQSANGAKLTSNIQLGTRSTTDASIRFVFDGSQIQYSPSKDLCLGLAGKSTAISTNIQLVGSATDHITKNWIYDGATRQIRSAADPDKCIEVETNGLYKVGSNLKLMDCDDHLRQQFNIVDR